MDQSVLAQLVIIIWIQKYCTYIVLIKLFFGLCDLYYTYCNISQIDRKGEKNNKNGKHHNFFCVHHGDPLSYAD